MRMKHTDQKGEALNVFVGLMFLAFVIALIVWGVSKQDTQHKARVMVTKKHRIVMQDDQGKWYEYTLNGVDGPYIDVSRNSRGEFVLPRGGTWTPSRSLEEEEDEATAQEQTTVEETDAGEPDAAGNVGEDSGGASSSDGGDGGGAADGGGGDGD
jgi:uncharacterized membrane protein YgcG